MFLSVPYAQPPVGKLRWKNPQTPNPYDGGSLKPTTYPPYCTQGFDLGQEDCLYLNVFAPFQKSSKYPNGYPVVVWIHGGDYLLGGANDYTTAGLEYAAKDTIFVAINYRLNIFGFFVADGLNQYNFGASDQTFALKWTKNNIEAFGGNPNKITIAGQSAGASSVVYQLISPASKNLFRSAIVMSYPSILENPTIPEAKSFWYHAISALGCDQKDSDDKKLACMTKASTTNVFYGAYIAYTNVVTTVTETYQFKKLLRYYPVVDKQLDLHMQPYQAIAKGRLHQVPLIFGVAEGDGSAELPWTSLSTNTNLVSNANCMTKADYKNVMNSYTSGSIQAHGSALSPDAQSIYDAYPCKDCDNESCDTTPGKLVIKQATDYQYYCKLLSAIESYQSTKNAPSIHMYYWRVTGIDQYCGAEAICGEIACHGSDIAYALRQPCIDISPYADLVNIENTLSGAFRNFIHDSDPSSKSLSWPEYDSKADKKNILNIGASAGDYSVYVSRKANKYDTLCSLWSSRDYQYLSKD